MDWFDFVLFVVGVIATFGLIWIQEKQIQLWKDRVKIWGECSYIAGWHDGKSNRDPAPPVLEDIIKEIEEEAEKEKCN